MDTVTHWAMIQSRLKEARRATLEAEGITESGLREMEDEAAVHVEEVYHTEYGNVQKIPDNLMLNKEDGDVVARSLGRSDWVSVESDEDGFELHISTERGLYVVNVHACAQSLLEQAYREIGGWYRSGQNAAAARPVTNDGDGYDTSDPKHPDWHSVHADLYDSREGK